MSAATAWPEGVIARYLTAGGATVDLVNERDSVVATCQGCLNWTATSYDDPACDGRPNRAWANKCASQAAQGHAAVCRALPKPGVAS